MYSVTQCILKTGVKCLEFFNTHSGIKQGTPSSITLSLVFMDELITLFRAKCLDKNVIGDLHILLHGDDTIILSTNRELFITKCNILTAALTEKIRLSGY